MSYTDIYLAVLWVRLLNGTLTPSLLWRRPWSR